MNTQTSESLSSLYSYIVELESYFAKVVYKFTPNDEFSAKKSIKELQCVYWSEIVQRLHVCGVTTVLRVKKWYEAINISYQGGNYYGFCASLRGLLEACADSFSTTGKILIPISEHFSYISSAIEGGKSNGYIHRD